MLHKITENMFNSRFEPLTSFLKIQTSYYEGTKF